MDTVIQQLIEMFKNATPELWKILIAQVQIEAIQTLVIAIFTTAIFVALIVISVICGRDDSDYYSLTILSTIGLALPIYMFIRYYGMIVNPEYYAIKIILEQIK